jgi:hypothetical protein
MRDSSFHFQLFLNHSKSIPKAFQKHSKTMSKACLTLWLRFDLAGAGHVPE